MNLELNQFRNVDVVLDKANDNFIQKQFVSAGDKDGRSLTVQITENGAVGEVIGLTLNLRWHNEASGLTDLSAFFVVDRTTSVFKIDYPQNMLTPGKVIAYIQILQGGKVTHTKPFEITVQNLAGTTRGVLATAEYGALVTTLAKANEFENNVANLDLKKADKSYVDAQVSVVGSGSPKGTYATLSALQSAFPSGATGIYVVTADGKWYYWNGSVWTAGGQYQATGLDETLKNVVVEAINSPIKNLVKNGNFAKGAVDWSLAGATIISSAGNELVVNTTGQNNRIDQKLSYNNGDVIYRGAYVKATGKNVGIGSQFILFAGHSGSGLYEYLSDVRVYDTYKNISVVDQRTTGNDGFSVMYMLAINLTQLFGKGKEPSKEEMNLFLSAYPNFWFDGTTSAVDGKIIKINDSLDNVKNKTHLPATNLVKNGNFVGATNWSVLWATQTVSNNTLTLKANGQNKHGRLSQGLNIPYVEGKKLFVKARARVTNGVCDDITLYFSGGTGGIATAVRKEKPVINEWYDLFGEVTLVSGATGNVQFHLYHEYDNSTVANGKELEVQYVSVIDLTDTFGKGNEPSASDVNSLFEKFENKWFDGSIDYFVEIPELFNKIKKLNEAVEILRNPVIKNPLNAFVKAVAHRGYSSVAPENTLPAYQLAKDKGFSYVETDIAWTSDEIPVLIHDDTIDRTSNGTGNVSNYTLSQLQTYDFGSWKSSDYAGTKIPTFQDFLIFCKKNNLHAYVELKNITTASQVATLVNIAKKIGMLKNVTWISFILQNITEVLLADSNARVGLNYDSRFSQESIDFAVGIKTEENDVFLNVMYWSVTDLLAESSLLNGIPVEVWTLNDATLVSELVAKGVSGISTDYLNVVEILGNS